VNERQAISVAGSQPVPQQMDRTRFLEKSNAVAVDKSGSKGMASPRVKIGLGRIESKIRWRVELLLMRKATVRNTPPREEDLTPYAVCTLARCRACLETAPAKVPKNSS
jgi:hypothetical protein